MYRHLPVSLLLLLLMSSTIDCSRGALCKDNNTNCPSWATRGLCDTKPGYMVGHCRESCDSCPHGALCKDNNTNCAYWANNGECDTNPGYMMGHCWKSCDSCPQGGWWSWSDWSQCTVTCGGGLHTRTRTCGAMSSTYRNDTCPGSYRQHAPCNTDPCPVDGAWTEWPAWSVCPVTCGTGTQTRTRTCTHPSPRHNGADCLGNCSQHRGCAGTNCTQTQVTGATIDVNSPTTVVTTTYTVDINSVTTDTNTAASKSTTPHAKQSVTKPRGPPSPQCPAIHNRKTELDRVGIHSLPSVLAVGLATVAAVISVCPCNHTNKRHSNTSSSTQTQATTTTETTDTASTDDRPLGNEVFIEEMLSEATNTPPPPSPPPPPPSPSPSPTSPTKRVAPAGATKRSTLWRYAGALSTRVWNTNPPPSDTTTSTTTLSTVTDSRRTSQESTHSGTNVDGSMKSFVGVLSAKVEKSTYKLAKKVSYKEMKAKPTDEARKALTGLRNTAEILDKSQQKK